MNSDALDQLSQLRKQLSALAEWDVEAIENIVKAFAEDAELKMGKVAQPLRAALTGTTVSPSVFDVMVVLGREETLGRIDDATLAV